MTSTTRVRPALLLMLAASGALFAWKYAPRLGVPAALAVPAFLIGYAVWARVSLVLGRFGRIPWALLLAAWAAAAVPLFLASDPEALRVDRWSALENFLAALFAGRYPYGETSHLGSPISGFPALFLLAAPFHLLGNVGWMQFAALAAFAILALSVLRRHGNAGASSAFPAVALLLAHPGFGYEVFGRSDLFANMVAVAWAAWALRAPAKEATPYRVLSEGALWGLLLATRGVVVIPFLAWLGAAARSRGPVMAALAGAAAGATALATLVPFWLWDSEAFLRRNPFFVQSGYIPAWLLALVALLSVAAGWLDPAGRRRALDLGILLFGTVAACFLLSVAARGWEGSLAGNGFDITYFNLAMPFLLLSLLPAADEEPARAPAFHPAEIAGGRPR